MRSRVLDTHTTIDRFPDRAIYRATGLSRLQAVHTGRVRPVRPLLAVLLLGALHAHASFDYAGVALAAAVSWAGIPGPGEPVLIAAGLYAARGRVEIADVLLVAWAGATAGGIAGWLLGRRGGRALWAGPGPLRQLRLRALAHGERFFERHVLLGVYLVPAWAVGIHDIEARRFLPANAFWALAWTLVVGGGAYVLGPSIADVAADLGLAGGVVLAALALGAIATAVRRRRREHAGRS
jgi:membrane protein DedA with SNARE-associated domain